MTHSREIFQMDNNQSRDKNNGFYLTKKQAFFLALLFVFGVVIAACLAYYFTSKSFENESKQITEGSSLNNNIFREPKAIKSIGKDAEQMANSETKEKINNFRLSRSVIPELYEIKLIPFLVENNFTFKGEVKIVVNVTQETSNITLHVSQLNIDSESVKVTNFVRRTDVPVDHLSNDTERDFFIVHIKDELLSGNQYEIAMKYTGILNDQLKGFYRSSYTVDNITRWIATTQFQPTDARLAFPCFDEPAMKAKFKLHIGRQKDMSSISNMRQINTGKPVENLPNYVWDEYEESVPMSTYLVAFVVSDFSKMSSGNFSVWARTAAINQTKYSLKIGPKILNYFEQYFGIKFPLPKMDMIALPDFASGAMENWGLITYRETAMLYEEGVSNSGNKQRVATVISHELAHQWFGNLVTPSWWTDLWLNEGFASYVEYIGVEAVEPSFKIMEQFVLYEVQGVFALDALRTSHQISVEVHHPDEINEIFDGISYAKGASLIRMMDHFLTTNVFKRGLHNYLKRHAYGNSEQDDLWMALTEQAHKDRVLPDNFSVKTIMDTWTLQTGYPVITVTRDYSKGSATVRQERFLLNKPVSKEEMESSDLKVTWWVPLTYTSSQNLNFASTNPSHWMKKEEKIVINEMPSNSNWVIFNVQQTGFYRVNYDEKNWKLLTEYLQDPTRFSNIHSINRAQLINDALNLARAELLSYETAMNLTRYLSNELEYLPWEAAFSAFYYLNKMLIQTAGFEKFKTYVLQLIQKVYDNVGFVSKPEDDQLTLYKRVSVLSCACRLGHSDCVNNSVTQFQKWKQTPDPDNNNPISPDLKDVVYCTAIRVGNEDDWNFVYERFINANVATEKDLLLESLACSREVWMLSRLMEWTFTDGNYGIRKQDVTRVFGAISGNPVGQIIAYNFLTENWDRIINYLGSGQFTLANIVKSATKNINRKHQLKRLKELAELHQNDFGSATRSVDQAIERANANIQWMNHNYNSLVDWLSHVVR